MHSCKSIERKPISTYQQKLSRKRAITLPKFCGWLLISNLTCILQWYILLQTFNNINTSLQKLLWKPISTHQQKLSQKKAITQPKFCGWLPISNLTSVLRWYKILQSLNEINASLQNLLRGKEQQKLSRKWVLTQPKFGEWVPISNLTCILQWYKVLQNLNETNISLQKLLNGNENCDDDTDDHPAAENMIPMCLPCYAGNIKTTLDMASNNYHFPVMHANILKLWLTIKLICIYSYLQTTHTCNLFRLLRRV